MSFCSPCLSVSESKELPEVVRTVLKQEITRLFGDSNARSFNQAYLTKHSNSIPHRLAGSPDTHTHTYVEVLVLSRTPTTHLMRLHCIFCAAKMQTQRVRGVFKGQSLRLSLTQTDPSM